MTIDLNALRREFTNNGISREQMNASPFIQFEHWMKQATEADLTLRLECFDFLDESVESQDVRERRVNLRKRSRQIDPFSTALAGGF